MNCKPSASMEAVLDAASDLSEACNQLIPSIIKQTIATHVTNPIEYAWKCHESYIKQYADLGAKVLLLGMNPGPWGMAQTGVPFGATNPVRELLKIDYPVVQPPTAHPKRPVIGVSLERQEASGMRLWGLLSDLYGNSTSIHKQVYLVNHCPLLILDEKARNVTPDKISGSAVKSMLKVCDQHLVRVVEAMEIEHVVGVGKYAQQRALKALSKHGVEVHTVWHPSPASPLANRNGGADWRENVSNVLRLITAV